MDGLKARLSFDAVAYDYDDEYLTIDTDTHVINISNVSRLFGVQYDGNSKLIKFRIRNQLSEIQKMQDSMVYINWIDQKGVKGQSIAIDKTISNDICEFAWKVPFDALKNSGVLHFAMSAVITENGSSVINQKWSTQIASVITPNGIYIKSYTPSSEEEDRIAQIYNELSKMINKQNDNLQSQVNSLNEALVKQLDLQELYKQKTVTSVQGYYDADLKGIGTLVTNLPLIITNIEIQTIIKGTGSAKLELLDANKNIIATSTSTYTNKLVFNFNDLYVGNYDKLWIRVSSETLLFARAECGINTNIINKSGDYATYFVNDNWNYSNLYNYSLLFTLNGKIGNNTVIVGTNEKFNRIIDAVQYCNTRPNYVWNIYIKEGTYDIYNELGGSSWYSGITSAKGNMQGISLANNVNLIGLGKVTLQFNPSDELATENNVPNVSVLELSDINNKIENIKIECRNCRYGIHDETDGGKPNSTRYFKNVEITHNGVVSGTWTSAVSYGCGSSNNSEFEYVDCKFNTGWLAHQSNKQTIPPTFIATNCVFYGGSYAISLNTSGTCKVNITFNNCEINYMVRILEDSDVWSIYGSGNNLFNYVVIGNNKINSQPFKLYDLTRTFKNIGDSKITKGNAVQIYKSGVSNGDNAKQIIGIALNDAEQNTDVRVQLKGYYDCYGVSPFSENNTLLGVSNGAIVANNENYFAIGVYVDDLQMIYIY